MSGYIFLLCLLLLTVAALFISLSPPAKPEPIRIEKTYVINLDSSTDRLAKFKQELVPNSILFERWAAVDGRQISKKQFREMGVLYWGLNRFSKKRQAELGCYFSHFLLWKHIVKEKYSPNAGVLIFEDDILLPPDFKERVDQTLQQTPNNWDILLLGYGTPMFYSESRGPVRKIKHFNGCFAYMINPATIEKIFPYLEFIGQPIDIILDDLASRELVTIYAPTKVIVSISDELPSTIAP